MKKGSLQLSNPTADVSYSVSGEPVQSGHSVTVNALSTDVNVYIFDGDDPNTRTYVGWVYETDQPTITVNIASGYLSLEAGNEGYISYVGYITGGVSKESNYLFKITGDGSLSVSSRE